MLHDPTNKDEIYQSGIIDNDLDALRDEFEYHYEKKMDSFQDKVEDFSNIFYDDDDVHPDELLARYDKKTTKYLTTHVFPFFKEMEKYYGSKIMDTYQEYINQITEERDSFVKYEYQNRLQEFTEEQEYIKLCQDLKKQIIDLLNKNISVKQAALINSYPKEQQLFVKHCIEELIAANRVFRVRKDFNKKGAWFLVLGKNRYNWKTL